MFFFCFFSFYPYFKAKQGLHKNLISSLLLGLGFGIHKEILGASSVIFLNGRILCMLGYTMSCMERHCIEMHALL